MSSQGSPTLELDLGRRCWERRVAIFALTSAALPLFPWPPSIPILLMVPLVVGWGLRRAGWLGGGDVIERAVWLADGRWLLIDRRGRCSEGTLRMDSRVGSRFVWLRWDANRTRSILLGCGDLRASELRRLIVRLRIEGARPAGGGRNNVVFVT